MTVEKLPPNEFIVKVRRGRMDRPVYMKRRAVMIFNHDQNDITFSYDNCCTILKAKLISQVPWSPPRGSTLRFMSDTRNEEEMVLEFENHGKMMEAFSLLKSKYLERSQFIHSGELQSSRGLHTTVLETSTDDEAPPMVLEPRRNRVKDLIDMFERLTFSPPNEKRSRQSQSSPGLIQSPIEELVKPPPLQSDISARIKENQCGPIFVEYRKRPKTTVPLTQVSHITGDYKVIKSSSSRESISGFANLGNTCYMNAMLQGLFAMDIFTRDLFKLCKKVQSRKVDLDEVMPMSSALSSLASVRDRASYHQKRELLKAVKDVSRFKGSAQQDANEFLVHVLNQVHDECDQLLHGQYGIVDAGERRMRNPVMANFAFTMQSTIICDMCHHVSQTDEDSIILPVTINVLDQASERFSRKFLRFPSVQTLLDEYLKTEKVERKCELCQAKSGERTQKFVQLPRCLIIFIKRYAYDVSKSVKRDDKIDIPLYLTLSGHCTDSLAPFLAVPTSTKKIDFTAVSPIKTKLSAVPTDIPSPAKRRLNLSDPGIDKNPPKIMNPAIRNLYSIRYESLQEDGGECSSYGTERTNTTTNHREDFAVPSFELSQKDRDQVVDDFVVPWNSSTEGMRNSSSSLMCDEVSHVGEEQLRTLGEGSFSPKNFVRNYKSVDSSIMSLDHIELDEDNESEVPRGQTEHGYSARKEDSGEEPSPSNIRSSETVRNELERRSRERARYTRHQQNGEDIEDRTESDNGTAFGITGGTGEMTAEESVLVSEAGLGARLIIEGSGMGSRTQSLSADKLEEKQKLKESDAKQKDFDLPCSSKRESMISEPNTLKDAEKREREKSARPSTPVPPNSPISLMSPKSPSSDNGREILEESGAQLVPYKPMSVERRRAICSQIGLLFNYDCIEKSTVRVMSPKDRPSRVAGIIGDGNCLFRALAFYFAGSDIEHSRVRECIVEFEAEHWIEFAALKGWSSDIWNDHMNHLLTDSTWGTEIELFAVAAMLSVDVWTFYDQRWICYRPRFRVQDGDAIPLSVNDYRMGDNEGIYLLNESNHFTPMLEPSNALLLIEGADERICDLVINANEGFMKPSYRLVSVVSHLGQTSESGHYVCDIWCKKNKGWLLCDDESISPINETKIRARNDVGYIYFYLNSELFESENA